MNARLLPLVDPAQAARWLDADLQVVVPDPWMDRIVRSVFAGLPIGTIEAGPPWGIAGSSRWLLAVGRATGRERQVESEIDREIAAARPRIDALARRASGLSLGFVGTAEEMSDLSDHRRTAGIPLAAMVAEAGFLVDLAVFGDGTPAIGDFPADRTSVHRFADQAGLESLLDRLPCAAVYSDFHADRRIGRAGKTPFSLQAFEPGLSGALATVEALIAACDLPFYRLHGRLMGRTAT